MSGSKTRFVKDIKFNDGLDDYRMTPVQVNEQMKAKGADVVYAF